MNDRKISGRTLLWWRGVITGYRNRTKLRMGKPTLMAFDPVYEIYAKGYMVGWDVGDAMMKDGGR